MSAKRTSSSSYAHTETRVSAARSRASGEPIAGARASDGLPAGGASQAARWAACGGAALLSLACPPPAQAQDQAQVKTQDQAQVKTQSKAKSKAQAQATPAPAPAAERDPGLDQALRGLAPRGQPQPQLRLRAAPQEGQPGALEVILVAPRGAATRADRAELSAVALPGWLRPEGYRFELTVRQATPGRQIVLFEALPTDKELSTGGSTTVQIAWVVEPAASAWRFIARATFSELDGGQLLELRPEGKGAWTLYRQRALPSMRFCGLGHDQSMELERYMPQQGAFVQALDLAQMSQGAPTLQAYLPNRPVAWPTLDRYFLWQAATSDIRNPADTASTVIRPLALGDRDLKTAWTDGSQALGHGEFVSARVEPAIPLKQVRIFPGHGLDEATHASYASPKRLLLGVSTGQRYVVELPKLSFAQLTRREGLLVELPQPVSTTCLSVLILEAYAATAPAPRQADYALRRELEQAQRARRAVAIAEITPLSLIHGLEPRDAARALLTLYLEQPDERTRQRLAIMARPLSAPLVEHVRQSLQQDQSPEGRARHMALLSVLPAQDAVPLLLERALKAPLESAEYRAAKLALYSHPLQATAPLFELIESLPQTEARRSTDLLRLIGRMATGPQLERLIPSLGQGEQLVRDERVRAIAGGQAAMIPALIEAAHAHPDAPAGEDALKALGTIAKRLLQPDVLSASQSQTLITLTAQSRKRRFKLRAITALGSLRAAGAAAFLRQELLLKAQDPLLRAQAAAALGQLREPEAALGLREALVDASPDVRISAMRAIGQRPDQADFTADVLTYAQRERWRQGLEPALVMLAAQEASGPQELVRERAVDLRDVELATLAARALVRARRGIDSPRARRALLDARSPSALRHQLIELLGYDRSEPGRALLIEALMEPLLVELDEPARVQQLRRAALMALGQRRDLRDVQLLIERALHEPDVELKQAALRALSFYQDARVIRQIEVAMPRLDPALRKDAQDAQAIIQRRLDIRELHEQVNPASPE